MSVGAEAGTPTRAIGTAQMSGPYAASMARKKAEPLHEPVASETQRDTVPTKALPPLSAFDSRSDGERLGACPACGGVRWWDNRAKKRAAQVPADTPDFTCVRCRAPHSEDDPPNPPGTSVTEVPAEPVGRAPSGATSAPPNRCQGVTKAGTPCAAGAPKGERFCPAHASQAP